MTRRDMDGFGQPDYPRLVLMKLLPRHLVSPENVSATRIRYVVPATIDTSASFSIPASVSAEQAMFELAEELVGGG